MNVVVGDVAAIIKAGSKRTGLTLLRLVLLSLMAGLAFGEEAGSKPWKPGLTVDGTHLTMRGYDILMNRLREPLA